MESLSLEEKNIINYTRNLFRLKKELNYTPVKDIRNLFGLEKEMKAIKIEYLEILRIFSSMKEKIIMNQ